VIAAEVAAAISRAFADNDGQRTGMNRSAVVDGRCHLRPPRRQSLEATGQAF